MIFSELVTPGQGELIVVDNPKDIDGGLRLNRLLPKDLAMVHYAIHDRRQLVEHAGAPFSTHARVHANGIYVTRIADRFQTEMDIGGAGVGSLLVRPGQRRVNDCDTARRQRGRRGVGRHRRARPAGTHLLGSDGNVRTNVWIDAGELERALAAMLGDGLGKPLEFRMGVDWGADLAVSLRRQIGYLASELRRLNGLASSAMALASLTDLILQTLLHALPHSYSDRLAHGPNGATPGILSRAASFMHAHACEPLRMAQVAQAAGCGVRTLNVVYSRFRSTTPMAALRVIRLARARDELVRGGDTRVADIAIRYGFSNAGRFASAYHRQFGELPSETLARR